MIKDIGVCDDISWERYHWGYVLFGVVDNVLVRYKYCGNGVDDLDLDQCVSHFRDHYGLGETNVELS